MPPTSVSILILVPGLYGTESANRSGRVFQRVVCAEDHCAYAMMGGPPEAIVQVDLLAGEGKGVGDSGGTVGVENSVLEAQQPAVQLQTISPPDLARVRAATTQFEQLDDPHLRGNNHWKKFLIRTFALAVVICLFIIAGLMGLCNNGGCDVLIYLGEGLGLWLCILLAESCFLLAQSGCPVFLIPTFALAVVICLFIIAGLMGLCNDGGCDVLILVAWGSGLWLCFLLAQSALKGAWGLVTGAWRHVRTLPSDHVGEHSNLVVPPAP